MIADVGKIATFVSKNGSTYNIYNRTCFNFNDEINFYDSNGNNVYKIPKDTAMQQAASNSYRCCYFSISSGLTALDGKPRLLIHIPKDTIVNYSAPTIVKPLYEVICPVISKTSVGDYRFSWWSNVQDVSNLKLINEIYQYDQSAIKKFSNTNLGDQSAPSNAGKMLCAANITWRNLRQVGGGVINDQVIPTPIIRTPIIITLIAGQGYVTDFSTGGDGGGLSLHSHISNDEGGFAAAVFMPSAGLRPINWK